MKNGKKIDKVDYIKFWPIDRDSPIFEIWYNEEIVLDIVKNDETGEFEVMFYDVLCKKYYISADLLIEIVEKCKNLIIEECEEDKIYN